MNPAIHFEIPVEDTKKAADFYGKVLGWQVSEMGYGDVYLAAATTGSAGLFSTAPGAINGAIGLKGRVTPERLTIVVRVEDIGRTLEAVKEHGGKVFHEKNPVGYVGFTACFTGHEGNLIGLWQDSGNWDPLNQTPKGSATFKTTVLASGGNTTGLEVPAEVMTALGSQKRPRVKVSLSGYTYQSTIGVMAGRSLIPLSSAHREAAGVKGGGQGGGLNRTRHGPTDH